MIYICKACQAPFKCCGAACGELGKCCETGCKGVSEAISGLCNAIGAICSKPLGGFVLVTLAAMLTVMGSAGFALSNLPGSFTEGFDYSSDCGRVKVFCLANIGCALVHLLFAMYIQNAVVKKAGAIVSEKGLEEDAMTPEDITAAVRQIFLNDFFFCFYFFAAAAIFAFNCWNIVNLGKCDGDGLVWSGSALMIAFGFVSANYAFCWYCGQCCFGKAKKGQKKVKAAAMQQPKPQTMKPEQAAAQAGDAHV